MAVPKRRVSKSKIRMRKASHKHAVIPVQECPACGAAQQPHRACAKCGLYRGRQVLTVATD
jgi:large subunit ribosomal protein L32